MSRASQRIRKIEAVHYFQVSTSNETACRGTENFKSAFPFSMRMFFRGTGATAARPSPVPNTGSPKAAEATPFFSHAA